jgi:hypothetical protein
MTKETVISARISRELSDVLRRDAESRGISFTSMVTEIFTKYAEWDRLANKFGAVTISKVGYERMWDAIGKEKAASMGKEGGSKTATEVADFWFKKVNTRTFLKLIELFSKYAKFFEYEIESRDEREYTITVHHDMNEAYSVYLQNWFESAIKAFTGVTPRSKVSRYSVVITFTKPFPEIEDNTPTLEMV